jgi:hypothetical protein
MKVSNDRLTRSISSFLNGVRVGRSTGSVDEFFGKAFGHGFEVAEELGASRQQVEAY